MSPQLDSGARMAEGNANRVFQRSLKHTSLVLKIQNKAVVAVLQKSKPKSCHPVNQSLSGPYAELPPGLWATLAEIYTFWQNGTVKGRDSIKLCSLTFPVQSQMETQRLQRKVEQLRPESECWHLPPTCSCCLY